IFQPDALNARPCDTLPGAAYRICAARALWYRAPFDVRSACTAERSSAPVRQQLKRRRQRRGRRAVHESQSRWLEYNPAYRGAADAAPPARPAREKGERTVLWSTARFFRQALDFVRNIDGRIILHKAQLVDARFQLGNRLFKIQKGSFHYALRACSRSVTSACQPRRTERRNRSIFDICEDSEHRPTQDHGRTVRS